MFDYFKAQGLNNLIWVWTSETGDADWYPGDQYVDIVGRDLYGKTAAECVSQYQAIAEEADDNFSVDFDCALVIPLNCLFVLAAVRLCCTTIIFSSLNLM